MDTQHSTQCTDGHNWHKIKCSDGSQWTHKKVHSSQVDHNGYKIKCSDGHNGHKIKYSDGSQWARFPATHSLLLSRYVNLTLKIGRKGNFELFAFAPLFAANFDQN